MTYVLEKKIANMKEEIRSLTVVTRLDTEVKDHDAQTKANIIVVREG